MKNCHKTWSMDNCHKAQSMENLPVSRPFFNTSGTPQYSWNTGKVGIKHQSILQDELFLFYYYCTRVFKFFSYCSERKCSYGNGILFKIRCRLGNTNAIFRKSWKRRICWNIWKGLYKSVTIYTLWRLIYTFLPI